MNWADTVFDGKPFEGVFIFDVHGHIGCHAPQQMMDASAGDVVRKMDRLGVSGICVSSIMQLGSDWVAGNEQTRAATEDYPGRIYGYASPNPFYEDCDLKPYFEPGSGFLGIKIHGNMNGNTALDDPRYDRTYMLANQRHLPILFHAWELWEVKCAINVARRYPDAAIILGHTGLRDYDMKLEAIEGCRHYDNIYLDTAISGTYDGSMEWIVNKVGADRVLYGSDLTFFECSHTLSQLATSRLSDTEKEKILGLNARPIFHL